MRQQQRVMSEQHGSTNPPEGRWSFVKHSQESVMIRPITESTTKILQYSLYSSSPTMLSL